MKSHGNEKKVKKHSYLLSIVVFVIIKQYSCISRFIYEFIYLFLFFLINPSVGFNISTKVKAATFL